MFEQEIPFFLKKIDSELIAQYPEKNQRVLFDTT